MTSKPGGATTKDVQTYLYIDFAMNNVAIYLIWRQSSNSKVVLKQKQSPFKI